MDPGLLVGNALHRLLLLPLEHANLAQNALHRIKVIVRHPLLQGNDRVIRDVDMFRADLRAALRNVAEAHARIALKLLPAVKRIHRMHLQRPYPAHLPGAEEAIRLLMLPAPITTLFPYTALTR